MIGNPAAPARPRLLSNSYLDTQLALAIDRSRMLHQAAKLGDDLIAMWRSTPRPRLAPPAGGWQAVVVAGVGGSATAGDYLAALAARHGPVPVLVNRAMELPAFVGPRTPVICCSHSGDTEETLACYGEARSRGAPIFALRAGGELDRRVEADGVAGALLDPRPSPRAALGEALGAILRAGEALGVVPDEDVPTAALAHSCLVVDRLAPDIETARNPAKAVAEAIQGRFALILAADHLNAPAERFSNQLAENGKALSAVISIPEAAHNTVAALDTAIDQAGHIAVVTLESRRYYPSAIRRRFDLLVDAFTAEHIPVHRIRLSAETRLAELLEATAWADFVSCYVGLLNGLDPTPIGRINNIRRALADTAPV